MPRPKGVRAVLRRRADGSTAWDWYCRETNTRLPDPASPDFAAALQAARRPQPKHAEGTIGAALLSMERSPEFRTLAPRTQWKRLHYLQPLHDLSHRPLATLRRMDILELRDRMAEGSGPAAGNAFAQAVAAFYAWAVDRGLLEYSPAQRIRPIPTGHWLAWTEHEAQHAMREFPEPARRAVVLAYHTGQRRGDLIRLPWTAVAGGRLRLVQEKTKTPLSLPLHPDLAAELEEWRKGATAVTVLTGPSGRPWTRENLSKQVQAACTAAGMRPGLNLHGLRKLAAARLAEAGASVHEIAAVTGHASLAMVALYTKSADQERLADAAVIRLSQRLAQKGTSGK